MTLEVSIYGGAGFVGRALAESLSSVPENEFEVTVIDNYSISPAEELSSGIKIVEADVTVSADCRPADWFKAYSHLEEGEHTIVWLPAVQGYDRRVDSFGEQNVYPIFNLFEAIDYYKAKDRIRRIVLASSQAVYAPGKNLTEQSRKEPLSVYGVSKLSQEQTLFSLARLFGINVYAMRYSVILGGGQSYDSMESGVLRNWARSFQNGEGPEVYGDGLHVRDFVHIDDVTAANTSAILSDNFENISLNIAGFSCSVVDLAYMFQEAAISPDPKILGECPRADGGTCDITSSYRLATERLGYEPTKDLYTQVSDSFNHFYALNV